MSTRAQEDSAEATKLITFFRRENGWVYEAFVWVRDPESPKDTPKFIPKGPIRIALPDQTGSAPLDLCFAMPSEGPRELWMIARSGFLNENVSLFKLTKHLDMVYKSDHKLSSNLSTIHHKSIISVNNSALMRVNYDAFHAHGSSTRSETTWRDPKMKSAPPSRNGTWTGLLVHPSFKFPDFNYVINSNMRANDNGVVEFWLDIIHASYVDAWGRGEPVYWKTLEVRVNSDMTAVDPVACATVLEPRGKKKSNKLLYFFVISRSNPRWVYSFYIPLRNDGSPDTIGRSMGMQSLQWFETGIDKFSDFRVESTHDRVVLFWSKDGKMVGKHARIPDDAVLDNTWHDFCDDHNAPSLGSSTSPEYFGSVVVPENFCDTPQ